MKYMGSKNRFYKELLPIILNNRQQFQYYVEPFCGGCNLIDKVDGNRIANDINTYLIDMFKELVYNNFIPEKYSKEQYNDIKNNKNKYPNYIVGYVGFNCSYKGLFFSGYAGETKTKIGTIRDYQQEAINNILKQVHKLVGVEFKNENYYDLIIPENIIIYCDPPYKGVSQYKTEKFNHDLFWDWCRIKTKEGHKVYISEYNAPNDFECIWSKTAKSSLSSSGNKNSIEKLFKLK